MNSEHEIINENNPESIDNFKKSKSKIHPKRFLKNLQQKFYHSQYSYLIFCFLVPIIIMYIAYIVKGIYPFGKSSPLVLDLNAQYVYFFEALRKFVYGEASLLYSFSRSLGGEFMGIVAYYMASPLTYIVALFPKERIQEAVLCLLLLKSGLSGLTFGFYLHKRTKKPKKLNVFIFSMLYALSAYAVVQQNNTMWIDALIWLPIFVYALENLITRRKFKLYVISLSVILISNYYIGYMVCIFAILYFFYYYFSKSKKEINPQGERLHFIRAGSRFAAFSILSAMISAFMLIAAYYSLGFGKSEFSNPDWSMSSNFNILDFLVKFLPGSYDTVEPAGLPFIYCGLLTVILLPIYFLAKKISSREKIASLALVAVFLLSFIISPIDLVWHGFSVPNWLNARYSFIFCFVILILTYKAFGNFKQTSQKVLIAIGAFIILLVACAEKFEFESFINSENKLPTFACVWFSVFFTVALIVLLCLKLKIKGKKTSKSISAVLTAMICLELVCNAGANFWQLHKDVVFTTYQSYNGNIKTFRPIVEQINEYDDGFYRAEKVYHRTKNDNMALGLKGITNSTSTLNSNAINFINSLGYTGRAHLTMYRGGTPFSDSLLGIKYVIDEKSSERFTSFYNNVSDIESEAYKVMQNPYALSLVYGVNKQIQELNLDEYDTFFERYNAIAAAMLGKDKDVEMFNPIHDVDIDSQRCDLTKNSSQAICETDANTTGSISFSYTAPYDGDYYFYPCVSYAKEITLYVNGDDMGHYMGKDTNHVIHIGNHTEGDIIKIKMEVPANTKITFHTKYSFLWHLNDAVYNDTMSALLDYPQFDIDSSSTDDHLFGKVSTPAGTQMMLSTIPYDEGWNVYVDGEKVETYETFDTLLAFDITDDTAREHSIEMKYMPSCYKLGALISIVGIVVFIMLCAADFVLKKTLLKNKTPAYNEDFWVLEDLEETESIEELQDSDTQASEENDSSDIDENNI